MYQVCDTPSAACTTTSDQIRAVHDAFRLIDADGDMIITLTGVCVRVWVGGWVWVGWDVGVGVIVVVYLGVGVGMA